MFLLCCFWVGQTPLLAFGLSGSATPSRQKCEKPRVPHSYVSRGFSRNSPPTNKPGVMQILIIFVNWGLLFCPDEPLLRKRTRENLRKWTESDEKWRTVTNIEEKYKKVGFDVKKERGTVHSVQGPLRVETNAWEADSTFILHHFFWRFRFWGRKMREGLWITKKGGPKQIPKKC